MLFLIDIFKESITTAGIRMPEALDLTFLPDTWSYTSSSYMQSRGILKCRAQAVMWPDVH